MKKYNIDGLPGFTMPGKKGITGERGCMTFCNVMNLYTLSKDYKYSIGITIDENNIMKSIVFPSNKIIPIKGDYVIDVLETISNLYVIDEIYEFSKTELNNLSGNDDDSKEISSDSINIKDDIKILLYASVKNFIEFVDSLEDDDIIKIFKLSLINEWTYKQGVSSKDLELSVSTQSFDVYRTSWKGEYTPKYLKKEISYISSPYTPFAHVLNDNYVINSAIKSSNDIKEKYKNIFNSNVIYANYINLYHNKSSLASYYTDIFDFELDNYGFVSKYNNSMYSYSWKEIPSYDGNMIDNTYFGIKTLSSGRFEKLENDFNKIVSDFKLGAGTTSFMEKIMENIVLTKVSQNDFDNVDSYNEYMKNFDEEYKNNAVTLTNAIEPGALIIYNSTNLKEGETENTHYLSFLKVNLLNSIEYEEEDDTTDEEHEENIEDINNDVEEPVTKKHKKFIINSSQISVVSNTYIPSIKSLKFYKNDYANTNKVNVKVFLGKNHFNYNHITDLQNVTKYSYDLLDIKKKRDGIVESYYFKNYSMKVYDVDTLSITNFDNSNEFNLLGKISKNDLNYTISGIGPSYFSFKYYSYSYNTANNNIIQVSANSLQSSKYEPAELKFNYQYLNPILSNLNYHIYKGNSQNSIKLIGVKDSSTGTLRSLQLSDLYLAIDIVKITTSPEEKINIFLYDKDYQNVPCIRLKENEYVELVNRKLYSFIDKELNNDESEIDNEFNFDFIIERVKNNGSEYLDDSPKNYSFNLNNDPYNYGIRVSIYADMSNLIIDEENSTSTNIVYKNEDDHSLQMLCESKFIYTLKDLIKLFYKDNTVDIPFTFICNRENFKSGNCIYVNEVSDEAFYNDDKNKIWFDSNILEGIEYDIGNTTEKEKIDVSEILEGNSSNSSNKFLEFKNITQVIEIEGLETDSDGTISIPIITTKPIISTDSSEENTDENNVYAFMEISYDSPNSVGSKYWLNQPFYRSYSIIDNLFYDNKNSYLNCYLLPRKFYDNEDVTNISGVSQIPIKNESDNNNISKYNGIQYQYENADFYFNYDTAPKDKIGENTVFAEDLADIPDGGRFSIFNGNILYYDTNSPSLFDKSDKLSRYDLLTDSFSHKKQDEDIEDSIIEKDPEDDYENIEDLIDYINSQKPEYSTYSLTQFIVQSTLKSSILKNIKIEAELSYNTNMNVKNVSSCVDKMWDTKYYSEDEPFTFIAEDNKEYSLPKKQTYEIMYDLYMKAVHNSTSVITEYMSWVRESRSISHTNDISTILELKYFEYLKQYGGILKNDVFMPFSEDDFKTALLNFENNYLKGEEKDNPLKYAYISKMDFNVDSPFLYSRIGLSKNYDNKLNFDNENIFPCTFVIKDYKDELSNGLLSSSIIIPKEFVSNCVLKLYAYSKGNSASATKILLGETKLSNTY